jgi:hypothetical protein
LIWISLLAFLSIAKTEELAFVHPPGFGHAYGQEREDDASSQKQTQSS